MNKFNNYISLNIQRFSSNAVSITGADGNSNISSNTSYISGTITITTNSTTYNNTGSAYYQINSGDKHYFNIGKNGTVTANYSVGPYYHNADGTLGNQTVSVYVYITSSTSRSNSVTVAMNTIPRASGLSAQSLTAGTSANISWSRASSSFTHTLTYVFGSYSGTIGTGLGTSASWTPSYDLLNAIPNSKSGTGTLTLATYNGSTYIGSSSATLTLTAPSDENTQPVVSIDSVSEANSKVSALGLDYYVQGQSSLNIKVSATAKLGASISKYQTTTNGQLNILGDDITTNVLNYTGTNSIVTTATDSRGIYNFTSTTYEVAEYSSPVISTYNVERDDTTPSNVKVTFNSSVYYLDGKNTPKLTLKYKIQGVENYTSVDLSSYFSVSDTKYVADTTYILTVSEDYQYDIQLICSDSITTSPTYTKQIGTAFVLMNYNSSGKGVAFGKVSEKDGIEFGTAMPIYIGNIKVIWWEED